MAEGHDKRRFIRHLSPIHGLSYLVSNTVVQWIEVRRVRGSAIFRYEIGNMIGAPFLSLMVCMGSCPILLKVQ